MDKTSIIIIHSLPDRKTKSLGNKALIDLGKYTILDYQIEFINKLVKDPEIIIVGGFEHKKLSKYISKNKKYHKIKYIYHEITEYVNIGLSIRLGLRLATGNDVIIMNGNLFIDKKAIKDIKNKYKNTNIILSTKQKKSQIGCIKNHNKVLQNCFFDLPYSIYDFIRINKQSLPHVKNLIYATHDLDRFYLFEIYNIMINNNIELETVDIDSRYIDVLDNINTIQKITRKQKKYV